MVDRALRRRIAYEAARLLHSGQEADYVRAKRRAVRKLGVRFRVNELPSNREVQTQLDEIAQVETAGLPRTDLRSLRLEALRWMRRLREFDPRLVGDVGAGHSGRNARIDIELASADPRAVLAVLRDNSIPFYTNEEPAGPQRPLRVHLEGSVPVRLTVRTFGKSAAASSVDRTEPALGLEALERELASGHEPAELDLELEGIDPRTDRFEQYRLLLEQLEEVRQDPSSHPEGDALYHSLQVFDLALRERPYDEEFLTAALLHDVGKAVNPKTPAEETLRLLDGIVTFRTLRLIRGMSELANGANRRSLEPMARVAAAPTDRDAIALLARFNAAGRRPGAATTSLDEALDYLRRLDADAAVA